MPERGEGEDQPDVPHSRRPAPKGNVDVRYQPLVEAHVPVSPEAGDIAVQVHEAGEILLNHDAVRKCPKPEETPHHHELQPEEEHLQEGENLFVASIYASPALEKCSAMPTVCASVQPEMTNSILIVSNQNVTRKEGVTRRNEGVTRLLI